VIFKKRLQVMKTPFLIAAFLVVADLAEADSFCDTVRRYVEYPIVLCRDDPSGGVAVFDKGGGDGLWFVLKSSPDDDLYRGGPCGHRFDDKPQTPCYRAKEIVSGLSDYDHNQAIRRHCKEAFGGTISLELCLNQNLIPENK
jgi:hypothetical protein